MKDGVNNIKKRALISGAGIAGMTAAYWLSQIGWEVVILEKASALREGEFVIDFAGTGWDVIVQMGLDDALKKHQTKISALSFQDSQGQEQARIDMDKFVGSLGVADKHASINRRDLQQLLMKKIQTQKDIELRFSTNIRSLEEHKECVRVIFEDGTQEEYDLVVGADGLHSNVRQLAFGDEAQFASYLGYHVAAFRMTGLSQNNGSGMMNLLRQPKKQAGILDLGNNEALALFVYAKESQEYVPHQQRKQVLINTFGDMGGPIPAILNGLTDQTSIYMDTTTQIVMPRWHRKRIVLIGDAAYCLTLVSGQGASMAMGGAYILAQALKEASAENIEQALIQYDARLRPFIEELQGKSKKFAAGFIPNSQFGLWMTNMMLGWVDNPLIKRFTGKQFNVQSLFEREAKAS